MHLIGEGGIMILKKLLDFYGSDNYFSYCVG